MRRIGVRIELAPADARAMLGCASHAVPFHDETSISPGSGPAGRQATNGCSPPTASATPRDAESMSSEGEPSGVQVVPSYWLTWICQRRLPPDVVLDAVAKTGFRSEPTANAGRRVVGRMFGSTGEGGSFTNVGTSQNQSLDGSSAGLPARSVIGPVIVATSVVGSGNALGSPIPIVAV